MSETKLMTFEEALKKLENAADALKKEGVTLEDAMKNYEAGIEYYKQCHEILGDAKQKIETFSK